MRDHLPPHVHVLLKDGREVLVLLETGKLIMRQKVRTDEIAEARDWIAARRLELIQLFKELQQ